MFAHPLVTLFVNVPIDVGITGDIAHPGRVKTTLHVLTIASRKKRMGKWQVANARETTPHQHYSLRIALTNPHRRTCGLHETQQERCATTQDISQARSFAHRRTRRCCMKQYNKSDVRPRGHIARTYRKTRSQTQDPCPPGVDLQLAAVEMRRKAGQT